MKKLYIFLLFCVAITQVTAQVSWTDYPYKKIFSREEITPKPIIHQEIIHAPMENRLLLLSEDFQDVSGTLPAGLPAGWSTNQVWQTQGTSSNTSDDSYDNAFKIHNSTTANGGGYWPVPQVGVGNKFAGANDDDIPCDCSMDDVYIQSPSMDFSAVSNIAISFDIFHDGNFGSGDATLQISTDGGATFYIRSIGIDETGASIDVFPVDQDYWQSIIVPLYDITDSNVIIRFQWTDAGSWASGFAVDNIVVGELPASDIRVVKTKVGDWNQANFGLGFWDYNRVPLTQVSPAHATSVIFNGGTNDQVDATMSYEVTFNGTPVAGSPFAADQTSANFLSLDKDTISVSTTWTPSAVGSIQITGTTTSTTGDDVSSNNTGTASMEITDFSYGRDGNAAQAFVGPASDFEIGNLFDIYADDQFGGIDVAIGAGSAAGDPIIGRIYLWEGFDAAGDPIFTDIGIETLEYIFTGNEFNSVGQNTFVTLPFASAVTLYSGNIYLVAVSSVSGTRIAVSGQNEWTVSWLYDGSSWAATGTIPMVRLNSNEALVPIPGCNDPSACNYNPSDVSASTCLYPGCTNTSACNFNPNAACEDGTCYTGDCNPAYSCDPTSYNFLGSFGISPDVSLGEDFISGSLGQPYMDEFYIKIPNDLSGINPSYPVAISIQYFHLDAISYGVATGLDTIWYPIADLGLTYTCNNLANQVDPCLLLSGNSYCGYISGFSNTAGVFPIKFEFSMYLNILGSVPYHYLGCTLDFTILPGCNNPLACNYNPADISASSCQYPGCTNISACNYNANAGCDDGSCYNINSPCNDNNPSTFNDVYTSSCNCSGSAFSYGNLDYNSYSLCSGENTQIAMIYEPVGLPSYSLQWYYKSGNVNAPFGSSTAGWIAIPGATTSVVDVNSFVGSRTYACFVTTDGSMGLMSQWANGVSYINYSSINAQAIIGNPNITPFNNYTYAVTSVLGNTYNWTVTNGAVVSGQGTSVVSILWGQNGPYQVTLTESDGTCSGTSVLFAVNNNCTISVSAASATSTSFCSGASVQLQAATNATNITYQWYLNGVAIAGETNQNTAASLGGNYQVSITQNGCSAISQILAITELPGITMPTLVVDQANAGCSGSDATVSLTDSNYNTITWSNGTVNASSINVSESGSYAVTVTDNNGCTATSSPVDVNLSLVSVVPICLVTVDQTTGKNNVVWEPVTSDMINSYVVLKETNVANVYAQIGTVAYGSNGLFEDVNANPQVQANRYKLALIDTCGILSSNSDFHKTIHLATNQGLGNNVNLIWSGYEGFDFGSYNIYRGASTGTMTLLTTIASNLDSYTDINPPVGDVYYMIEVEGVSCDPQRTLVYSHSNILDASVGVEEFASSIVSLFPNPATTSINLQVNNDFIGKDFIIYDAVGKVILKDKITSALQTISTSELAGGNYILKVGSMNKMFNVSK